MNVAAPLFAKAIALTTGSLLATANLASQPVPARHTPMMATANYTVTYTCSGGPGCTMGAGYEHTYTMNIDIHGAITGTGMQTGYPQITEKLTGALTRKQGAQSASESLNYLSTYDGLFAGYTVTENGAVDLVSGNLDGSATATMPGLPSWAASFKVKGVRTSFTLLRGHHEAGIGDNDDSTTANPPIKHTDEDKPEVTPARGSNGENGQGKD